MATNEPQTTDAQLDNLEHDVTVALADAPDTVDDSELIAAIVADSDYVAASDEDAVTAKLTERVEEDA